jgi:hypothetical protein
MWAALAAPFAVAGGLAYASFQDQQEDKADKAPQTTAAPYVCPITGEELPCTKCCPLNQQK